MGLEYVKIASKGVDDMRRDAIRMTARALSLHQIKVCLSAGYYNGISSRFYLKEAGAFSPVLLHGDMTGEENGFKTYEFNADIELGKRYTVMDAYGLTCQLDLTPVSQTAEFDELYDYDGEDLGASYSLVKTIFKVWAPLATGVTVRFWHGQDVGFAAMTRGDKGVWSAEIVRNLEGYEYVYVMDMNGLINETCDPYAYASTANMRSSVVINLRKVRPPKALMKPLVKKTDAIIYELGVRDFSVDPYGHLRHKGKFLAFCENGNTTDMGLSSGIDYLEKLGVTHIQLMPVNDFATVDEDQPYDLYNWGYDPAQYNVTEGSYVTDPNDGYRRIMECQAMVQNIHKHGMRVILDVVYNHMHDVNKNALEGTVPGYFFRMDGDRLSNGSWCGNDLNSAARMCRRYILAMCRRWQRLYGVDGFRMDLMGIVDIDTVRMIEEQGRAYDPSFMLYGEGWNMGTALPDDKKAIMDNHESLPHVGFFNDHFRDTMRGSNQMETKGYISGDTYKTNEAIVCLCDTHKFTNIEQNLNYVECHDNGTVFDKFVISNSGENDWCLRRRCQLATAVTLLAQGVPFLHAGQEFYGTKGGNVNSYNAGDSVNMFDWGRRDRYNEDVRFVAGLIRLRKENPCFRYADESEIREHITITNINHQMIDYRLTQDEGPYKEFRIFINPSYDKIDVEIDNNFKVLLCMEDEKIINGKLRVTGVSLVVCAR